MNTADRLLIRGPDHSYNLVTMTYTWAKNQSICKSGKELNFFLNSLSLLIPIGEAFFSYFPLYPLTLFSLVLEHIWNSWLMFLLSSVSGLPQWQFPLTAFFSVAWVMLSCMFACVVTVVKNRTFKTIWQLWKSDSSFLQGLLLFLVLALNFFL